MTKDPVSDSKQQILLWKQPQQSGGWDLGWAGSVCLGKSFLCLSCMFGNQENGMCMYNNIEGYKKNNKESGCLNSKALLLQSENPKA